MSLNLAGIVESAARRFPNETALIFAGERTTHAELRAAVRRAANGLLGLGVRPGDKVALMVPNRPEFTIAYFGILMIGATVVPLNTLFVGEEVGYHLRDSDAVLLITWEEQEAAARAGMELAENCRQLVVAHQRPEGRPPGAVSFAALLGAASPMADLASTMPDDTAVILYTSGTTGRPKGAELTHFNLWSNAQWSNERSQSVVPGRMVSFGPGSIGLVALPLFHSFGQSCLQNCLLFNGAAISYLPRWNPEEALRRMDEDGVTHFAGVPTMYFALLHSPDAGRYRLERLRYCLSGGAPMPVEVMAAFEETYRGRILEGYGLSETSPVATFHTPEFPRRPGSVGKPIDGCEVQVWDDADRQLPVGQVGEVVIRGHNIMKGYYKRPEATAEAMRGGWFHSGDLGRLDEEGYLYIVDRKKDMILRGGFNVYPRELEEVIYAHPAILEAAVLGVPDPEHGEEVVAVLALKEGCALTREEFTAYCKQRMAAYKYPRRIEFRDTLPKGATGKILKRELRDQLARG
jgi:long-chain acyl-CoA synthetase